jgi:hypothetical protein
LKIQTHVVGIAGKHKTKALGKGMYLCKIVDNIG